MVRDLSIAGAAIDVPSTIGVPDHFTLTILTEGLQVRCRAVWRDEMRLGVAFE
jgi:hypothetical protein